MNLGFSYYLCVITKRKVALSFEGIEVYQITKVDMIKVHSKTNLTLDEEEQEFVCINAVKSILTDGNCYYSLNHDLTRSFQQKHFNGRREFHENIFDHYDQRYLWNYQILKPLLSRATFPFIIPIMYGFMNLCIINSMPLLLKSKVSWNRAGCRYWKRGIDEQGYVAMDVVTEMTLIHPSYVCSYCIHRGSTPLLWCHRKIDPWQTILVDTTRAESNTSKQSCKKHFTRLMHDFGPQLLILDLLGKRMDYLAKSYESVIKSLEMENASYYRCDGDLLSKSLNSKNLGMEMKREMQSLGFFCVEIENFKFSDIPKSNQNGIIRVSCLDCVDETNVAQYIICSDILKKMLITVGLHKIAENGMEPLQRKLRRLWMQNGDSLSYIYVGSPCFNRSLESIFNLNARMNVPLIRIYMNFFQDQRRQEYINIFTGKGLEFVSEKDLSFPLMSHAIRKIQNLRIAYRKATIQKEFAHGWFLSFIFFFREVSAPTQVKTPLQFIGACFWLMVYFAYVVIGRGDTDSLIRRTQSFEDMGFY
jgi:hypothetical protein